MFGAILTIIVNIPSGWYGAGRRDSYLFDPAVLSPLWIQRVLVPALAVLAGLGLLVGLVGLVRRDWPRTGRSRRWGGILGVIGIGTVTLSIPAIVPTGTTGGDAVLATMVALLGLVLGLLLLLLGLLLLGFGYVRTGRPRIGYAFFGVIVGMPLFTYLSPDAVGSLLTMLPVGIAWVVIGLDLFAHTAPLGRERTDTLEE